MALLRNDLPLTIIPLENNPRGLRFNARLKGFQNDFISISMLDRVDNKSWQQISVEFKIDDNTYKFQTMVCPGSNGNDLLLFRPSQIDKIKVRAAPRISQTLIVQYALPDKIDKKKGILVDLSELGIRIAGKLSLKKGTEIGLDFFIEEHRIHVITQGEIVWSKANPAIEKLYDAGINFSRLPRDIQYTIGRYIYSKI